MKLSFNSFSFGLDFYTCSIYSHSYGRFIDACSNVCHTYSMHYYAESNLITKNILNARLVFCSVVLFFVFCFKETFLSIIFPVLFSSCVSMKWIKWLGWVCLCFFRWFYCSCFAANVRALLLFYFIFSVRYRQICVRIFSIYEKKRRIERGHEMFGKHIFNHSPNQISRVLIVEKWTKVEKHENQMTVANDGSFRLLGVGEF